MQIASPCECLLVHCWSLLVRARPCYSLLVLASTLLTAWVLRALCEDVLVFVWVLRGPTKKTMQIAYEYCHQHLKPMQIAASPLLVHC